MAAEIDDTQIAYALLELDEFSADHVSEELSEEEKGLNLLANTDLGDEDEFSIKTQILKGANKILHTSGGPFESEVKAYVSPEMYDDLVKEFEE